MKRVEECLEELGIKFDIEDNTALVEFWTDTAGQDIPVELDFDGTAEDFVEKFREAAEDYDVNEQVALFVENLGKQGVPRDACVVVDDCREAKDTLMEIAEALEDALNGIKKEEFTIYFDVRARYKVTVRNTSLESAIEQAETKFSEADFGEAYDIDGEAVAAEDEEGNDLM